MTAPGIGLAAIQVGVPKRVVTMDLSKKEGETEPRVFINPEIMWASDEPSVYEEGCLSIPEVHEDVERPAKVRFKYLDLDGKPHETEAEGLFATCIQHEVDHLNGVLFIDHISKLKRDRIVKKFTKAAKRAEEEAEGRGLPAAELIKSVREQSNDADLRPQRTASCRCASIFMGTPDFAVPTLLELVDPRARRRGGLHPRAQAGGARHGLRAEPGRARGAALRHSTVLHARRRSRRRRRPTQFRAHAADAAVVVAYGLILPKPILDAPPLGCFNLHASALPRWRGAAPINRAIMAGDAETAVMVMRMEEGLDTGPIAMAEPVAIGADMTAGRAARPAGARSAPT